MTRWALAAWLGVFVSLSSDTTSFAEVAVGDKPPINLRTIEGKTVTSQTLLGRIVILDFWATWCGPCMRMIPHMIELNKKYRDHGVVIIGISLDNDLAELKRVVEDKGLNWPQSCHLEKTNADVVRQFGIAGIPNTVILTPQGRVAWQGHPSQLEKPLAETLKKYPPRPTSRRTPDNASLKFEDAIRRVREAGRLASGEKRNYAEALKLIENLPSTILPENGVLAVAEPLVTAFNPDDDDENTTGIREALKANPGGAKVIDILALAFITTKGVSERAANDNATPPVATPDVIGARPITAGPQPSAEMFVNSTGMKMVLIKPGEFMMGSPSSDADYCSDEIQHHVKISKPFWMGTTEVTQAQWRSVMGNDPSHFKGDDLPVEHVSWEDAQVFCNKLSEKEGLLYRLPTESEWEYACRAGTTSAYNNGGNEGSSLQEVGWYGSNSEDKTHVVGQKEANAWGLWDMHGNVWEWCMDNRDDTSRVLRGGAWASSTRHCRSAYRRWMTPGYRSGYIGFRLVLELPK